MIRVGIDLGGTKIEGVALAPDGRELARERVATPAGDYAATLSAIVGLVRRLGPDSARVGIGMPGAIAPASGLIKNANSVWLIGRPLDRDLAATLGRPVRLANDADCFALSEATDGAAAGAPTVFGVILGTGVGAGIVVAGRLVAGPNAIAGEWGHNPLPWPGDAERPGPRCYCGRHGCIETFLSGPGLARDHGLHTGRTMAPSEVAAAAAAGEAGAVATLERYADRLARGLAHVINILDPHVIVLGGGLSNLAYLYEALPKRLGRFVFSDRVDTKIVPARFGDASGVRGAAWLWPASDDAV